MPYRPTPGRFLGKVLFVSGGRGLTAPQSWDPFLWAAAVARSIVRVMSCEGGDLQMALTRRSATDLERRDPFGFWTLHWPECLWTFPSVSSMASDGMLHIHAERRQEEELEDKDMYRSELRDGVFTRTLPLPAGVGEQDVDASHMAGILEIRNPVDQKKARSRSPSAPADRPGRPASQGPRWR